MIAKNVDEFIMVLDGRHPLARHTNTGNVEHTSRNHEMTKLHKVSFGRSVRLFEAIRAEASGRSLCAEVHRVEICIESRQ